MRQHLDELLEKEVASRKQEIEKDEDLDHVRDETLRRAEEPRRERRPGLDDDRGPNRRLLATHRINSLVDVLRDLLNGPDDSAELGLRPPEAFGSARHPAFRA